jgi:hypothetical protein
VSVPDHLDLGRHRDLLPRRRRLDVWTRRVVLGVLLAFCAAALANVFGQRAVTSRAAGSAASLVVKAPDRLRGGLVGQARFTITARRRLTHPRLVLGAAWLDGITINTIVPDPSAQADDGGALVLSYDELPAGRTLTVRIALQVNPTTIGRRRQDTWVRDGRRTVARVRRTLTIFP